MTKDGRTSLRTMRVKREVVNDGNKVYSIGTLQELQSESQIRKKILANNADNGSHGRTKSLIMIVPQHVGENLNKSSRNGTTMSTMETMESESTALEHIVGRHASLGQIMLFRGKSNHCCDPDKTTQKKGSSPDAKT